MCPFVTVHMFCASGDIQFLKEFTHKYNNIFAWVKTISKKQILARVVCRIQKERGGGPTHFSEIIQLKFGKKLLYILCILTLL